MWCTKLLFSVKLANFSANLPYLTPANYLQKYPSPLYNLILFCLRGGRLSNIYFILLYPPFVQTFTNFSFIYLSSTDFFSFHSFIYCYVFTLKKIIFSKSFKYSVSRISGIFFILQKYSGQMYYSCIHC